MTAPPINIHDFETAAQERLDLPAREYLGSGAADEITLRRNREAFDEIRLEPRVLVDVSRIDTSLDLLGERHPTPILIAPTGYQRLFHPEGELEVARGAAAVGVTFVLSTVATTTVEDIVAAAPARLWFQLYVQRDRDLTRRLIERAEAAGAAVLVVTVDTPVLGSRDRERRLVLPEGDTSRAVHLEEVDPTGTQRHHWEPDSIYSPLCEPALTWKTIEWIRSVTRLPIVLKGILSPVDARLAAEAGMDAVIVSNHGGRNLDTAPAAIEALPHAIEAVSGRLPVLMDGGVRRGTDVLKALALGARAVLIGRPVLWGLAVDGARGVQSVVEILHRELMAAMALCGVTTLGAIDGNLIWKR